MSEGSYYFDPTEIDNLDEDGEESLDNWKPKAKKQELTQSEWRKNQIGDNFNQEPGLDDLDKIHSLIRKKAPDSEIMRVFGINAHTLIAIKERRYCPVDGISLNNLSMDILCMIPLLVLIRYLYPLKKILFQVAVFLCRVC